MILKTIPKRLIPRTPKTVSKLIREFATEIGDGDLARVPVRPTGRAFGCFYNSARYAAEHGGIQRVGWSIWELPGVYLTAEFHAVAEVDGQLIDTTPTVDDSREVLFCWSPEMDQQFRLYMAMTGVVPSSKFKPISTKTQVIRACQKYAFGCRQRNKAEQQACLDGDRLIEAFYSYNKV